MNKLKDGGVTNKELYHHRKDAANAALTMIVFVTMILLAFLLSKIPLTKNEHKIYL